MNFFKGDSSKQPIAIQSEPASPERTKTSKILSAVSYSALDKKSQKTVMALYSQYASGDEDFNLVNAFKDHTLDVFRQKIPLANATQRFQDRIANLNPASFQYLSKAQTDQLIHELSFGFYLLSAQYYIDETESRRQHLQKYSDDIKKTAHYLTMLRSSQRLTKPELMLRQEQETHEKHCKYLALKTGQDLGKKVAESPTATTKTLRKWMDDFNERRLYWVWGGGLLATILELIPDSVSGKKRTQDALAAPADILGNISWSLYYARFGLELTLLLKHTFKGPWMNEREELIPRDERALAQWNERKFILLNDFIWGAVNLVTFFWLVGKGMLGYWGNALTVGPLLFDASMALWRLEEEKTKHLAQMILFEKDLEAINLKIEKAKDQEKAALLLEKSNLEKAKRKLELDRKYQYYHAQADLVYSVSLIVAFFIAVSLLIPPGILAAQAATMISLAGALLCFALTLAYNGVKGGINIAHQKAIKKEADQNCQKLIALFKEETDPRVKKLLYLDILQEKAESDFRAKLINYEKAKVIRSIVIDSLIPPLIFLSFMFLPTGAALGILAAGFAIILLSNLILKKFEPKKGDLPKIDGDIYEAFEKEPSLDVLNKIEKSASFFKPAPSDDKSESITSDYQPDISST